MVDAVVIGTGVAGAAAAWELSRRGRSVVVLEQFGRGHDRGSSHGGERIVRLAYTASEYVELGREALSGWEVLEAEAGRTLFHRTGAIDHGDAAELEALVATYEACAVAYEWLAVGDASARWPGLHFEGPVLHQPDGGWVEAAAALEAFLDGAAGRGVGQRFHHPVGSIEPRADGVRVTTADGHMVDAGCAVVAGGAWAKPLLAGLVDLPPITVTEELVAYCRPRAGSGTWPAFIVRGSSTLYGLPTPDGLVKVGGHGEGPVVDPDHRRDEAPSPTWDGLLDGIARWVPGVELPPVRSARCLYATTPTDDFVLDRVGPIVVAAGLGGHGFKFGPALGRVLADLVDGVAGGGPFALGAGAANAPGPSGYR
jgi:sarcosine oxidase